MDAKPRKKYKERTGPNKPRKVVRKPLSALRSRNKGVGRSVVSDKAVKIVERAYQILTLRRDGYSIREIAKTLGVSEPTVYQDLQRVLNTTINANKESVEQHRMIQGERLDKLIHTYMPLATEPQLTAAVDRSTGEVVAVTQAPNPAYANIVLMVEQRRSKLLGLDTPETKNVNVTGVREYVGINPDDV